MSLKQTGRILIPCGHGFQTLGNWNGGSLNVTGVYTSSLPPAVADETAEVRRAFDVPIGSEPLEELARHAKTAVVIASDHTRPVPSRILMPELLARLRRFNPEITITILIASGFHRQITQEELEAKFGPEIIAGEKIMIHRSDDAASMVNLGRLPSGNVLEINRIAAECDLLVSEGFIEPHFFAGFSGGRKSVLPGIASKSSIMANHCAEMIADPRSRTGILDGNPIHLEMEAAARTAKLRFIINVVINAEKKIVRAFAGDPFAAHQAGTDFLSGIAKIRVPEADIVITGNGGAPLDQNLYQCVKSMTAGEAVCRDGGIIILCAACADGHGGESFLRTLSTRTPAEILMETAMRSREQTIPDQWQAQICARVMMHHKIIFAGAECDPEMICSMGMDSAPDLNAALQIALNDLGGTPRIAVIPDGVSVIAEKYPTAD